MTTQFAKKLAIITEIKNVLSVNEELSRQNGEPWTICDSIVHHYNNIEQEVTKIKVHRMKKKKHATKLKVYTATENKLEGLDFVDSFVTSQNVNHAKANEARINADMDRILPMETIQQHSEDYTAYFSKAADFLQRFNYFKQYSGYCMRPEDILTGKEYLRFLTTMTNRMIKLATIVSQERFNAKSALYYGNYIQTASSVTAHIVLPGEGRGDVNIQSQSMYRSSALTSNDSTATNNIADQHLHIEFIPKTFKFTNKVEHKNTVEEFAYLVKQLHFLCWNISDTYYFVNTILYNYATSGYIQSKQDTISKYYERTRALRNKYRIEKAMDCAKLPETWTERIKYWFYNIRASDDTVIHPFGQYFKYIEFWFQSNKITNGLQKFKCDTIKEVQRGFESDIDFVSMLFNITPASIQYGASLELTTLTIASAPLVPLAYAEAVPKDPYGLK